MRERVDRKMLREDLLGKVWDTGVSERSPVIDFVGTKCLTVRAISVYLSRHSNRKLHLILVVLSTFHFYRLIVLYITFTNYIHYHSL